MDGDTIFGSMKATVAALTRDSREAFDALYRKYVGKVHNFILRVSGDPTLSEDITQEVFVKLWRKRKELDPDRNIESWLFVCARNLFLNEIRRWKQGNAYSTESRLSSSMEDNSTLDLIDYHFTERGMASLIKEMPPQRQKIFLLALMHGLSAAEIAELMGISDRTVENQIYKARKHLSEQVRYKS